MVFLESVTMNAKKIFRFRPEADIHSYVKPLTLTESLNILILLLFMMTPALLFAFY